MSDKSKNTLERGLNRIKSQKNIRTLKPKTDIADNLEAAGLSRIYSCTECGLCSGICPSGALTSFNTRRLIQRALEGDKTILSDQRLWLCSTCYACQENCPHLVPITDIIIKLRNMAVRRNFILPEHRKLARTLIETGHGVPINDLFRKLRQSLGLGKNPPTVHSSQDALREIRTLIHSVGFDDLVGDKQEKTKSRPESIQKISEIDQDQGIEADYE